MNISKPNRIRKQLTIIGFLLLLSSGSMAQTVIFSDDFETDKGWTISSGWQRDNSSFTGSAGNHFHTTPFNNYNNNMTALTTSPIIDLSGYVNVNLRVGIRYNTEADWDGLNVEYSDNGGSSWNILGSVGDGVNWYNDTDVDAIGNNTDGWSGDNGSWETASISLPSVLFNISNLQIRFRFESDGLYNDDGVAFDNFEITGTELPSGNLADLVYWLRGDLGVTGATPITEWADQSGNGNDATPDATGPNQMVSTDMNNQQVMEFNGSTALTMDNDARINAATALERTMFVAFRTGADVTTTQYLYEQGGGTRGIGVYIKNGSVYVIAYTSDGDDRIAVYETVSTETSYILSFIWDNGNLSAKLNNVSFANQTSNGATPVLTAHTGDITIGQAGGATRDENGTSVGGGLNFIGQIGEIIYYDAALLEEQELDTNLELADRYGIVLDPIVDFYSYQTGAWNNTSTWTHDPGGTTQTATTLPNENDKITILSGRTVTLTDDVTANNLDIIIRDGGVLDLSNYEFTASLLALRGTGTFKLATTNYPSVATNDFVTTEGGTTEYNNTTNFTLPTAQTEYNHLRLNAAGVTATQLSNITLNGDLHIKQGTYQINDNSANRRQLIVNGDVLVDNGASLTIGTGNTNSSDLAGGTAPYTDYYVNNSHRIDVYGDFTNNGTVKFTNQSYPEYDAFPSDGMATVYFMGASNNTLTCNGTTDFYNMVLSKGIDQTYKLTVYSTAYNRFRLFGRNDQSGENSASDPYMRKALWLHKGTLELTGLTSIPSLSEAGTGGSPNGDFYIPVSAALHINGSEVIVLSTADDYREVNLLYGVAATSNTDLGILTSGGNQSFSIYGKLQVDNGYFSTRESGGIITWDYAAGQLIINGGTVDAKQFRAAGSDVGLASFNQNGGKFILRGRFKRTPTAYASIVNLKDFSSATLNTTRDASGLDGNLGTFNLNRAENVFAMTDGTISIYDVCGTGQNEAFQVFSDEANNNVTGGTLEIIPTTGTATNATTYKIETTANLGNLTINRTGGTIPVDIVTYPLTILNNATITSGDLNTNNLDVTIGGNLTIASGATYNAGTNTTTFNGSQNQTLSVSTATAQTFNNLTLNNTTGSKLTLSGTQTTINVNNTLTIQKGELADNGKTINVTGNIYNAGTHSGGGKIILNGATDQTIDGSGNGIFGNIELNNTSGTTAPVSMVANATINGTLTFSQDKLFDISTYKLTFGTNAAVANAGTNRFIKTAGNAGDGGVTKTYSTAAPSFTFPVGSISTRHAATAEYTPASIDFTTNPTTFGNITVIPVGYEHPNTTTKGRSLTYFWRVKSEGFDLGPASINHSYTYAQSDVVATGDITENGYIPAVFSNVDLDWTTYTIVDVNETTNIIGGTGTLLETLNFIDGEFTAGDNVGTDPFGEPTVYYSRINGLNAGNGTWDNGNNWSTDENLKHEGPAAGDYPQASDIAIIGGKDSIYLLSWDETPNRSREYAATLRIEKGSALDIGYNPGSVFAVVLNHENGNGNFRLTTSSISGSTFEFPAGDFSDFNTNVGTTELYTTNPDAGTTYWLPNDITAYGNLIISPLGGSNIIFGNTDVLIYGNLLTRGQNSESWYCPNWRDETYPTTPTTPIAKTITINGNFHLQGGALIYYNRNNTGAQDFVIGGDLILDAETGIQVHTQGNGNTQAITIGGNLKNNSLTPGSGVTEFRGADFTNIPLTFTGTGTHYITNDNPAASPYTIIESLTLDKGDSQVSELIVNITGTFNTPTDNWLTLVNGTFKYLHDDDLTITEDSEFIIPSTAGLYINSPGNTIYLANDNVDDNDVYLQGKLTLIDGNVYVGQTGAPDNNNDIEYSGGGDSEIDIQGGSLTVNGQIRRNPATSAGILKYKQSGGDVTINGRKHNTDNAKLEVLNSGSIFNMSGGTLTIERGGGSGTYGDLYLRPESSTVTGGTIVFNPDDVNADQNYIFDANTPIWNLTINGADGYDANVKLLVSPLTIKNDLLINTAGTLDANVNFNIPITIKGDYTNNGLYEHRENLTTFNGGTQTISGTSDIIFNDVVIAPVTSVTLSKNVTINNDITLSRGTLICGSNYVNISGDVTNNATYTDVATGFVLEGRNQQSIGGSGTWGQLELNNASGARLTTEITLTNDFILTKGIFDINAYLLTLQVGSDIVGIDYNESKMITSDGVYSNVGISKVFSSVYNGQTFTFPLGTSGKYTPVDLSISNIDNPGSIRVNNINSQHPGVIDPTNVLAYFWDIESNGITNFTGTFVMNYLDDDVRVTGTNTEADYIAAHLLLPGTSWSKADNVNDIDNTLTFNFGGTNSLSGEYTAGVDEALPDEVPEFISDRSGNWSTPATWRQIGGDTYTLTGAPNGFILTIAPEHTVTTDANYATSYRIAIEGTLKVINPTYGHNLGTVTGSGTLYLENGTFPAGRYLYFFDCDNNSTLEYSGSTNYALVADLYSTIANLHFTGTGSRTLPNKDLSICNELIIDGPTVDNTVNNKKLTIEGTLERYNTGAFISGTGANATVAFAGTNPQTVGGILGDFSGSNAFNNLEINNPAGLTINEGGDIEVTGKLILTDGLINTGETNQLDITNTNSASVLPAGGHSGSFVNGPLTKTIIQGDAFNFPIGKDGELGNKLVLSASQSGTIDWTAEYFTPNDTYTSYNSPLSYVNSYDRWSVSATAGSQALVGIKWDANSDLTPANTQFGTADMRVALYDEAGTVWDELTSTATGNNTAGTVTTSSRITIPATGYSLFSSACINTIKPRAKLTPSGAICGTNGIPVSFSSSPTLNYILSYTIDGGAPIEVTVTSTPYQLPTIADGGVYKLISFTYDGGKTGAVDQSEITAYEQPDVPNAGIDQSICGGTQANISGSAPSVGSVLWSIASGSGGSIVAPTAESTTFNGTNGSGYTLTYTVDNGGCTASDDIDIDFPVLAAQPESFLVSSTNVCQTESGVEFTVPNDATVSYTWNFDNNETPADGNDNLLITGTGNSITADFSLVTGDGTLSVTASNACGDSDPRTIDIDIHPMPVVTLTDDDADNALCLGSTIEFTATETSGLSVSTFNFLVNGSSVQSGASNTFTTDALTNGSTVEVIVTSDATCATTSSTTTIAVGDRIWDGNHDSDWNQNGNWSCGNAPNITDDVIVPTSPTNMPVISTNAKCADLTVESGATVTLTGATNFDLYGDWINNGEFIAGDGTVNFKGNASISGVGTITFTNLTIDNGVTLTSSSNNINITGTLTNNGAFTNNGGTVTLNGTSEQTISGDFSGINALHNVVVNNPAGITLASGNKQIDGTLTLTNGLLTSNGLLTLGQNATTNITAASGKVSSYINGMLHKVILGNSAAGFFFPVGTESVYKPVGVSALANAPGTNTWTAQYSASAPAEYTIQTGEEITRVSNQESWSISSTNGDAKVTLAWDAVFNGDIYVTNSELSSLRVVHLGNSSEWTTTNAGSVTGDGQEFGTVTSGDVITFDGSKGGPETFTLGTTSNEFHPLPVELVSFAGKDEGGKISLNWVTATETNNHYFEVQHSTDADYFQTIGKVTGAGTSATPNNYGFMHNQPVQGINYYRLKQTDFDGNFEYHQIIAVHSESISLFSNRSFEVYPNPYNTGDITIEMNGMEPTTRFTIMVISTTGNLVAKEELTVPENLKLTNPVHINELATGMYLIQIEQENNLITKRLIIY